MISIKSKLLIIIVFVIVFPLTALSQSAESAFHLASNQYIHKKFPEAKLTIDNALRRYPNDPKLTALKGKIKEDEKKENQQNKDQQNKDQQNKDKQNKDQQNKDQQNKDQQNKDEKNKDSKEQKDKEQKEQEQKQQQNKEDQNKERKDAQNLDREKLQQMKISEDKARMILEAMKNQEKQYLQQQKRKATKQRESGKPDW